MDFYILIAAAIAFVVLGFSGRRKNKEALDVRLGWIRISAGLSMSFVGGAATIAMAGIGYHNGLIGFVDPVVVVLGGVLVALSIRSLNLPTAGQGIARFLARGARVRTVVYALCSLFVYTLLAGAQVVALSKIFAPYVGAEMSTFIAIATFAAVSLYILLGGIGAVTKTDVAQFVVVSVFFLVPALVGISLLAVGEPIGAAIAQTDLDLRTILLLSLSLLFVPLSQDVWIRVRNAKSVDTARIGLIVGVLIYFLIVGSAITLGHLAAKSGMIVDDPESILPFYFTSQLGLAGVITAIVLLAAVMSTLDSFTFNLVSTVSEDLWPPIFPRFSQTTRKAAATLLVFIACTVIAFFAVSVLDLVLTALMIYVSVIGPGYVLNRFVKREVTLWAPALIILVGILYLGITGNRIPFEPYSIILIHFILIGFFLLIEWTTNGVKDRK